MKITINNRDLPFTIDTYGMFNGESHYDSEAEYYADELGYTGEIDFDFDHAAIVKDLATYSVSEIENIVNRTIIKSVSMPIDTHSPEFYNYTTDSYDAVWDIDERRLLKAIETLTVVGDDFQAFQLNSNWGLLDDSTEDYIVCALDFFCQQYREDYEMAMFEHEFDIYSNNCKPSKEMQAELDKLGIK